jgi:outer membrane protein assembly factor BamD
MNRWFVRIILIAACLLALPFPAPAPLIYRTGEGWSYEAVGSSGEWQKKRAKDQLEAATQAFDKKDYTTAMKAAKRTVAVWPLSDFAPEAQFLIGRCYEAKKNHERAFKEYQKLLEKYPKYPNSEDVLKRQYEIANLYLGGKWFKLWGLVPLYPSMEKTADMYEKVIKNAPYSEIAPDAQMKIGSAQEKRKEFPSAVKAYERAADRYNDRKQVAADSLFKAGLAYYKQAKEAEYDQNASAQAIATFNDFITLYPDDPRLGKARENIEAMRMEQARGAFQIARFYEKRHRWSGALVYYNEVLLKNPDSKYAGDARKRIDDLKKKVALETPAEPEKPAPLAAPAVAAPDPNAAKPAN